jgi:signal transduction histidine kinase
MTSATTAEPEAATKFVTIDMGNVEDAPEKPSSLIRSEQSRISISDDDGSASMNSADHRLRQLLSTRVVVFFILLLGAATAAAFTAIGVTSAKEEQRDQFDRRALDLVNQIQRAWEDYVTAAAWIHGQCRSRGFTRTDFRQTYEYLINSGLSFQAAQFDPNITHAERPAAEEEARKFYDDNYPTVNYRGFIGFNYDNSTSLDPRNDAPFYFPIHYMEPVVGNEVAIDLDYHASGSRQRTVLFCMDKGLPALTDRLRLVQEKTESAFGVVLMHPGYNLTTTPDVWPHDLASIVIRIPDLLRRSTTDQSEDYAVYIYDKDDSGGTPLFLGAAVFESQSELIFQEEKELDEIRQVDALIFEGEILAANKEWIIFVHSLEGTFKPNNVFVILGGLVIFASSIALALFVRTNTKRVEKFNKMRASSDAEKASLILDNARQATVAERELNDFIAHEVRNPVAAAMAACSFVKSAVNEPNPLITESQREETRGDVGIIENALRFVNDLLRNMLDMHRAANKQLKVNMTPTDLLLDVLEPVHAMLPQRDQNFEVQIDCPDGLVVMTDRLRLKQVCLNLARNSVKFIDEGFIRLRAEIINHEITIFVEDSGPGIPKEKQEILFNKFQESLDSLSQGTVSGVLY